jgi:hypothetical protein
MLKGLKPHSHSDDDKLYEGPYPTISKSYPTNWNAENDSQIAVTLMCCYTTTVLHSKSYYYDNIQKKCGLPTFTYEQLSDWCAKSLPKFVAHPLLK